MVRPLRISRLLLIVAAAGLASAAYGIDLLEKMQAEVAAIVKSSKGAVVTIEDEAIHLGFFGGEALQQLKASGVDADAAREAAEALKEAEKELAKLNEQKGARRDRAAERELRARLKSLQESRESYGKHGLDIAKRVLEQTKDLPVKLWSPKSGTGFSIGDGYIVSTADVVEGMERPVVITDDGTRIKAKVAGIDADLNVAILTVPRRAEIPALRWGDSTAAVPGYFAISIGNQTGNFNSAALNLVAGIRTEGTYAGRRFYPRLLQVAGTVGQGSSGAPLLNTKGEVIGMMAAVPVVDLRQMLPPAPGSNPAPPAPRTKGVSFKVAAKQGDSEEQPSPDFNYDRNDQGGSVAIFRAPVTSAGFAVPANDVRPVVEALREGRQVARGFIGVTPIDIEKYESDGEIARIVRTVCVSMVTPDSPACKAGIEKNDILVSFNGKPIRSSAEVRAVAISTRPGETLRVEVRRDEKILKLDVQIGERPGRIKREKPTEGKPQKSGELSPDTDVREVVHAERFTNGSIAPF